MTAAAAGFIGYENVPISRVPVVATVKGHQSVGSTAEPSDRVSKVVEIDSEIEVGGREVELVGNAQIMFLWIRASIVLSIRQV